MKYFLPEINSEGRESVVYSRRPISSRRFTGRREYLQRLKDYFNPRDEQDVKIFLLYGMGGIGKTQICLRFAEENKNL